MATRAKGRALCYLRRSTSRQEVSLESQLGWAIPEAQRRGVPFDASSADLAHMQALRLHSYKAVRLDDGITGADMNRPGFLAVIRDLKKDKTISHLLIHRRDRFARPEDAIKMVALEKDIRLSGVTIVFCDGVAEPLVRGCADLAADVAMMFGYYESGEFLRKHAERVLDAQRLLALGGYRTGGNAPYGFGRVLVDGAGDVLEDLAPGRLVRQAGCHVRVAPKDPAKIATWIYILELKLKGWGYKRIAAHLNELGIPSPGMGSFRTDQGVRHAVSGKWGPNTVKELCENRAILGLQDYGRRSEGAHRRLGEAGHRLLTESDYAASEKPKVVLNEASTYITAPIGSASQFDRRRWSEIRDQVGERGKSQRGIPRAKDPSRFPLACRIVDLTDGCGALMYGYRHGGRPVYVCGAYMRTAGADCAHNHVDGEAVLRFALRTLRQLVERHGGRERLRAALEEHARRAAGPAPPARVKADAEGLARRLAAARGDLATVQRRMALERDDARYEALAREFDRVRAEAVAIEELLASSARMASAGPDSEVARGVDAAMSLFDDITRVTSDVDARVEIHPLMLRLGLRLGLSFGEAVKGKKRVIRRLVGGVLTFRDDGLPVPLFGSSNAESGLESSFRSSTGDGPPDDHGGPSGIGVASNLVPGSNRERLEAGGDVASPPASDSFQEDPPDGRREGVSFTKDNRGGGI